MGSVGRDQDGFRDREERRLIGKPEASSKDPGRNGHEDQPIESETSEVLTSIPTGIHCTAGHESEIDRNGVDSVMIGAFLRTLAEVALAVASRKG